MSTQTLGVRLPALYEQDFVLWAEETARLLRAGAFDDLDIENLAEEIESIGRKDRRELRSRLKVLLSHLLKWRIQPDLRSGSWRSTMAIQRSDIDRIDRQKRPARASKSSQSALEPSPQMANPARSPLRELAKYHGDPAIRHRSNRSAEKTGASFEVVSKCS